MYHKFVVIGAFTAEMHTKVNSICWDKQISIHEYLFIDETDTR